MATPADEMRPTQRAMVVEPVTSWHPAGWKAMVSQGGRIGKNAAPRVLEDDRRRPGRSCVRPLGGDLAGNDRPKPSRSKEEGRTGPAGQAASEERADLEVRADLGPRRGRHQRGDRRGPCAELGSRRGRHQRGGRRHRRDGHRARTRPRSSLASAPAAALARSPGPRRGTPDEFGRDRGEVVQISPSSRSAASSGRSSTGR